MDTPMDRPLLQATTLSSGYGRVRIVHDVSFGVREAEVFAIIGRNGVGKTTLLRTLIGDLRATQGDLRFEGSAVDALRPSARARLGMAYVPQGRGIFTRLTTLENLTMGARIGDAPVTSANYERIYGYFPILRERAHQMAGTLSGGQQQQIALGRALLGRTRLLLLDEPSEGIQPNIVREIGVLLRRLSREERLTVVVVEQNLEMIRLMADRCVVLDKGTIVAEIRPEELDDPLVAKRHLAI